MQITTLQTGLLGTCCYILKEEGRDDCAVIDPGGDPQKILGACGGRRIAAILLTHGHFDHIGAVDKLRQPDAMLAVHELDAPMLQDPELNACRMIGRTITCQPASCLLTEGEITCAGIRLTVLHTPGHTPGSVCYQAGEHLFTGDTLFRFGCGRTDLPGGNMEAMRASLRRLHPLAAVCTIHPGHEG